MTRHGRTLGLRAARGAYGQNDRAASICVIGMTAFALALSSAGCNDSSSAAKPATMAQTETIADSRLWNITPSPFRHLTHGAGYIDRTGAVAIPLKYNSASPFVGEHAIVSVVSEEADEVTFYLIDRKGNRLREFSGEGVHMVSADKLVVVQDGEYTLRAVKDPGTVIGRYDATHLCYTEGLLAVKAGGQWQFIDEAGKTVIGPNPEWKWVQPFSDGLAAVWIGDKWGFLDTNGRLEIEPRYDRPGRFAYGLANIEVDGKVMYINKKGGKAFEKSFCEAEPFSEGMAAVDTNGDDRYGFIDVHGRAVIPEEFEGVDGFSEGLANFSETTRKGVEGSGFIDKRGRIRIKLKETAHIMVPFSGGLATIYTRSGVGLIDKRGRWVWRLPDKAVRDRVTVEKSPPRIIHEAN